MALVAGGASALVALLYTRRKRSNRVLQADINDENNDWVFGFGSLIDCSSRAASMSTPCEAAVRCVFLDSGLVRTWNFRSSTGFTAIGVTPAEHLPGQSKHGSNLTGVCFYAGGDMASLDTREKGYRRERVPLEQLALVPSPRNGRCNCARSDFASQGCRCDGEAVKHFAAWLETGGTTPGPQAETPLEALIARLCRWVGHGQRAPRVASPPRVWIYLAEESSRHSASLGPNLNGFAINS